MNRIKVTMKDETVHNFMKSRSPYEKGIRYEGMFVIIRDEFENETAFPANDVKKVENFRDQY